MLCRLKLLVAATFDWYSSLASAVRLPTRSLVRSPRQLIYDLNEWTSFIPVPASDILEMGL